MHLALPGTTAKGPSERFAGDVHLTALHAAGAPSRLRTALVRFAPGARTHWHSHPVGQTLYCTEGTGLVANRDGEAILLRAGDTVYTPPGEEHWHGATRDSPMCHLAMVEHDDDGQTARWLDAVTEHEYQAAHRTAAPTSPSTPNEQR
ncbi:(R)-mandelonitrile lyase [Arthrobacter sp. MMS24-T111]